MSCGVGGRFGSNLELLWLWCGPAAVALIRPLAWEPPYACHRCGPPPPEKKKKEIMIKAESFLKNNEVVLYVIVRSQLLKYQINMHY